MKCERIVHAPPVRGALKLKAACEYLGGLSVPTMHRLIERGLLRPNRALRHLLFPIAELDRFLRGGCEAQPSCNHVRARGQGGNAKKARYRDEL